MKIDFFLFFYLIQFSLSVEEGKRSIRFIKRLGEPVCSDDKYSFDFSIETKGFSPPSTYIFYYMFGEPYYYFYNCELKQVNNYQIFNCYVWLDHNPLINQTLKFKKNINGINTDPEIYDWDKLIEENITLSENANCVGNFSYEFIPNKEIPFNHSCLPDYRNEIKIKGFFIDNNKDKSLKSTEYENLDLTILADNSLVNVICNIFVLNNETNSNNVYESEMVCKFDIFNDYKRAYIYPTKSKKILFHDFPEYDLSCGNENSGNFLSLNKLILFLILLFLDLLL